MCETGENQDNIRIGWIRVHDGGIQNQLIRVITVVKCVIMMFLGTKLFMVFSCLPNLRDAYR